MPARAERSADASAFPPSGGALSRLRAVRRPRCTPAHGTHARAQPHTRHQHAHTQQHSSPRKSFHSRKKDTERVDTWVTTHRRVRLVVCVAWLSCAVSTLGLRGCTSGKKRMRLYQPCATMAAAHTHATRAVIRSVWRARRLLTRVQQHADAASELAIARWCPWAAAAPALAARVDRFEDLEGAH
jgi:hypothetical protein